MARVDNFSAFYAMFKHLPNKGDFDELKNTLVYEFTAGRTTSLRAMNQKEYKELLKALEAQLPPNPAREAYRGELRFWRSVVLKLLQKIGVDTTNWNAVDEYCLSPKISGKIFSQHTPKELEKLSRKLRVVLKKKENKNK